MNNTHENPAPTNPPSEMPDPRPGLAVAAEAVQSLLDHVATADFARPTPCDEFDVHALLDHITMVFRRSAAIGAGAHFSTVEQDRVGETISEYQAAIAESATAQDAAWSDPARLYAMVDVPWGTIPGGAAIATYTAELATHGWDLATAIGREFTIPDDALAVALFAIKQIPAEGRDSPDIPFGAVVDPGPDAPALLTIAGWGGRQVI